MRPMKSIVRLGVWSSFMFLAYHPISGLATSRKMISAWYTIAVKSDRSVSTEYMP